MGDNTPTREALVCFKRPTLARLAKHEKLRGYTSLKKCDLVNALAEYYDNREDYPIPRGRKTRDIKLILRHGRSQERKKATKSKKPKRGAKNKTAKKANKRSRMVYESSSDEDVPLVRKRKKLSVPLSYDSQDTIAFSPESN